jgi:hypothetical protein
VKKEHNVIVTNFNIYLLDKRGLASRWASTMVLGRGLLTVRDDGMTTETSTVHHEFLFTLTW